MSASFSKSLALTVPGPCAFSRKIFGRLTSSAKATFRVLRDPGQVRELMEYMLNLHPRRRGPGDGRQEDPAVGDAHREGEPRLEWR